jgi:transcriptional regulator with XRE-family HTH domain
MSPFGEQVRWQRRALGLTQRELAAKIKLRHRPTTASYISRIEAGKIDPHMSTMRSIGRALGVKPWCLVADISENVAFWEGYLALSPNGKREAQRTIEWISRKGR